MLAKNKVTRQGGTPSTAPSESPALLVKPGGCGIGSDITRFAHEPPPQRRRLAPDVNALLQSSPHSAWQFDDAMEMIGQDRPAVDKKRMVFAQGSNDFVQGGHMANGEIVAVALQEIRAGGGLRVEIILPVIMGR